MNKCFWFVCYLQIRLRDYGVLDFDAGDARRQPPIDTTWQQVTICMLFINHSYFCSVFFLIVLICNKNFLFPMTDILLLENWIL